MKINLCESISRRRQGGGYSWRNHWAKLFPVVVSLGASIIWLGHPGKGHLISGPVNPSTPVCACHPPPPWTNNFLVSHWSVEWLIEVIFLALT